MIIHGRSAARNRHSERSKNAGAAIMMASLLTSEPLLLSNVPRLRCETAMELLIAPRGRGTLDR